MTAARNPGAARVAAAAATAATGMHSYRGLPLRSLREPCRSGSGGNHDLLGGWMGGNGGGLIRVFAEKAILLNGQFAGRRRGRVRVRRAAAGGGVTLVCKTLSGTGGRVSANGGISATIHPGLNGGGGGGGRIAVRYDTAAQAWIPDIVFSAAGAFGADSYGEAGTLWFPDNRFLTETVRPQRPVAVDGSPPGSFPA